MTRLKDLPLSAMNFLYMVYSLVIDRQTIFGSHGRKSAHAASHAALVTSLIAGDPDHIRSSDPTTGHFPAQGSLAEDDEEAHAGGRRRRAGTVK